MDCGVVLEDSGRPMSARSARPSTACSEGDRVLVDDLAVRVVPAPRKDPAHVFGFMSSEVSAERPKELTRGGGGRAA